MSWRGLNNRCLMHRPGRHADVLASRNNDAEFTNGRLFEKGGEVMNARTSVTSTLLALLLLVIGTLANPGAEAADTVVMHAGSGTFAPQVTTIEVGDRVTWVNDSRTDDIFVTSSGPVTRQSTVGQDELEMNAVLHPGTSYAHAFKEPGTYYNFCAGHMDMWGPSSKETVIVKR
jgi:plastocyanin